MTNKILISLCAFSALTLASCQFEDEDYFDESASLRVEHFNDKVAATLVKPEHGWVMQYFTGSGEQQFEGFNLYAKFKDSKSVLIAGNHRMLRNGQKNKYTEHESLYSLLQEEGPLLAFNTWNDVLTVFCDPVDPSSAPDNLVNDGQGMQGDYQFDILSLSEDTIKIVGQRYRAQVQLVKCEMPWQEHIDSVAKKKDEFTNTAINAYYLTDGVDTMYVTGLRSGKPRIVERLEDPLTIENAACCFTLDGFHFEKVMKFKDNDDIKFQDFVLNPENTMLVSKNGNMQCIARWDAYIQSHTAAWKFDAEAFSAEQTAMYDRIAAALKAYNANYSLESLAIGKTTGGKSVSGLVVTFYTNAAKSKTNTCGVAINMSLAGFGSITYDCDESCAVDQNLTSMAKKATDLEPAVRAFAQSLNGTYKMTPDSYFLPTGAIFTAEDGASFVLK